MAARIIIVPGAMPSRDANGRAVPAKLRFYEPGAAYSTPATVYTDSTLTVAHAFPILSDAAGRWPQIWADDAYTFDVTWSDQVYDRPLGGPWTDLSPANDAVLASVELAQDAQDAAETAADRAEAAADLAEAYLADATGAPLQATSATSLTIGTGSKSLTLDQTGKLFVPGQTVVIARDPPNAATQMTGVITAFDSATGAMTVAVALTAGAGGPYTDWNIAISSSGGVLSIGGETGVVTAAEARAAIDVMSSSEAKAFALCAAAIL